jgi:hypothetical protein
VDNGGQFNEDTAYNSVERFKETYRVSATSWCNKYLEDMQYQGAVTSLRQKQGKGGQMCIPTKL